MFGGCTGLRSENFFTGKGNLVGEICRVLSGLGVRFLMHDYKQVSTRAAVMI